MEDNIEKKPLQDWAIIDKKVSACWQQVAKDNFPNAKPHTRKILKCSRPDYWYADLVGTDVQVTHYGSFGCWDAQGRWMNFYDLTEAIEGVYHGW